MTFKKYVTAWMAASQRTGRTLQVERDFLVTGQPEQRAAEGAKAGNDLLRLKC